MRFLTGIALAAGLLLSGCVVGLGIGHHHRGHRGWHHGHHHGHFHWNSAGTAYDEAAQIKRLDILRATLPGEIHGYYSENEENKWRRDWPEESSKLIAEHLTDGTDREVRAVVVGSKPASGYYATVEFTYIDVGYRDSDKEDEDGRGGIGVLAKSRIFNATSGEMVAEVKFEESFGRRDEVPFDEIMEGIGDSYADWFNKKQDR